MLARSTRYTTKEKTSKTSSINETSETKFVSPIHSFSQSSTRTPWVSLGWIKAILAPPAPFLGS